MKIECNICKNYPLIHCHRCKKKWPQESHPKIEHSFKESIHEKNKDGTPVKIEWHWISCPHCGTFLDGPDFETLKKQWNYWEENFFYMEDLHSLEIDTLEFIKNKLNDFDIKLSEEDSEAIHDILEKRLEKLTNGEYKNFN